MKPYSAARWTVIAVVGGLLMTTAVVSLNAIGRRASAAPPNLLLVSIDTLRADHVSSYGYGRPTTPVLDALAREGHRFARAYAVMPTTLPSHVALFTSLYPSQTGVRRNGDRLSPRAETLTEVLRSAGYRTAGFVSAVPLWHGYGLDQGFDEYHDVSEGEQPAERTVGEMRRWLQGTDARPFFAFVHFYEPHADYYAPQTYRTKMGAPDRVLPPDLEFVRDPSIFTPEVVQATIRAYDAEIASTDASLGAVLEAVKARGLFDSTIVVVTSDHGESLDELLRPYGYAFDHGEFLYAHQLHVPLVLRLPNSLGREAGPAVHDLPVSLLDLMPTLLDLLSVHAPPGLAGRSLRTLLAGKPMPAQPLFAERRPFKQLPRPYLAGQGWAMLDWPWHLVVADRMPTELFDDSSDPAETRNIAAGAPVTVPMERATRAWSALLRPSWPASESEADPATLERLKALGYVQ